MIGDKAVHHPTATAWRQQYRAITLVALPRPMKHHTWPAPLRQQVNNVRRTIESALRVLCTVLHGEQLGSRSLAGVLSRVTTRWLAYTLSFIVWAFLPTLENSTYSNVQ